MRIDKVYIKKFKNLSEFNIDLNENEMKSVLLGQNATGKSNFIEALVLIFKYLDLEKEPPQKLELQYRIEYYCRDRKIYVNYLDGKYSFKVQRKISSLGNSARYRVYSKYDKTGKEIIVPDSLSKTDFFRNKDSYLPKYVFTYYSGISNRLKEHFNEHQRKFYDKIIKPNFKDTDIDQLRKLFYVQSVHSHFVLLAYYSYESDKSKSIKFLKEVLGIEDLESILFILRKPRWNGKGDVRFFGADGLVKKFLEKVWKLSLAPIYSDEKIPVDFRSEPTQKRLYLFIKDKQNLKKLAETYNSNTEFFKALESTYISDLIEEVRVKVKKKFVDGSVTFKELSEGEQQLLTVMGLLKFTKDEESLILLDEPDTHLNPIWKWRYLEFLDEVVQNEKNTQIVINTHDPLVIGGLTKEQVRIFTTDSKGKILAEQPDIDPRGLGVEGILTSELFGLPTTLDEETQQKLDRRNELLVKQQSEKLNDNENGELQKIFGELEELGFSKTFRDPLFQKFIVAYKSRIKTTTKLSYTKEELQEQNKVALEILDELQNEEDK
ncbi:MAG: AAA family ATPase [Chitinophagaceae bacterium]|nr:AAA family ATPase [Chitinophagaceae bacterium]